MKSKIDGRTIPENECIVWIPHKAYENSNTYKCAHTYHFPCERFDGRCDKCGDEFNELFEVDSPVDHGTYKYCYDCIMELNKWFTGRKKDECPVCGFGILSIGPDGHICIFGHVWDEQSITRKVVKSKRG